ncbi:MAG: peptide chain release factor 2 [Clostridia bacterium]|nr:peptide chain release factor 2 [Clostridia bacterium]
MTRSSKRQVGHFNPDKMKAELSELRKEQEDPAFWTDMGKVQKVNKRVKTLETTVNRYESLRKRCDDAFDLMEMLMLEEDDELGAELVSETDDLANDAEELHIDALLSGPYDANNAIVSIHAGAGGTEAQDWAQMLYRMYTYYCEKKNWKLTVLDLLDGDEAGIKSVTFRVEGEYVYGYLKAEKGVHRLVRISPFDAASRRHTSFTSVDVMPEIDDDTEIEIRPEDLRVDTYRSSGAGGQHVNKTESAIRITHIPTGIVVSCQNERSQIQNRETAMKVLRSKLAELKEREQMEKLAEIQGDLKKIEWGSQIRSYVFHPYQMVKDHRTGVETGNIDKVMNGDLEEFVRAYLIMS